MQIMRSIFLIIFNLEKDNYKLTRSINCPEMATICQKRTYLKRTWARDGMTVVSDNCKDSYGDPRAIPPYLGISRVDLLAKGMA